jgi:hypothetical protein
MLTGRLKSSTMSAYGTTKKNKNIPRGGDAV